MTDPDARPSGMFAIGGDLIVNRLGFNAMRIAGKGIWGEPENPGAILCLQTVAGHSAYFVNE